MNRQQRMAWTRSPERLRQRINGKIVVQEDGCWQWTATLNRVGYGQIKVLDTMRPAHRVSYEAHVGPIPDGLELDHLCRNRACVNPAHLEPVTHAENMRRSQQKQWATHVSGICQRGHDVATDYVITNAATGSRACRQCRNQTANQRRAKQRARDRAARG